VVGGVGGRGGAGVALVGRLVVAGIQRGGQVFVIRRVRRLAVADLCTRRRRGDVVVRVVGGERRVAVRIGDGGGPVRGVIPVIGRAAQHIGLLDQVPARVDVRGVLAERVGGGDRLGVDRRRGEVGRVRR